MVIYDQWSYMIILLHEFNSSQSTSLIKYYIKYQFVRLIKVEFSLPGMKFEVIIADSMNFFGSSLGGKIAKLY